ncbi:MAG: LysE family transporter [Acinetobacter sp.]|nr:LysE family transporter [Acinetobacter sp.]
MTIDFIFFLMALVAVFLIPGPTNALLANTAYQKGIWSAVKHLPAQYLGYIYAIGLWGLCLHIAAPYWTAFSEILHFLSIVYILFLSFRLWKASDLHKHLTLNKQVSNAKIFYSCLKNPKAILFTAGIFPPQSWDNVEQYSYTMLLLGIVMIPCALFWMFFGRALLLHGFVGLKSQQLYKGSALLLIFCSIPVILRFFWR